MPPLVSYPNGSTRNVKNLGWLLRHASQVRAFYLHTQPHLSLCAELEDGRAFHTTWASLSVFLDWVGRRSFLALPLHLDGVRYLVGSQSFRAMRDARTTRSI